MASGSIVVDLVGAFVVAAVFGIAMARFTVLVLMLGVPLIVLVGLGCYIAGVDGYTAAASTGSAALGLQVGYMAGTLTEAFRSRRKGSSEPTGFGARSPDA